jgi:hypothetical protein
VHSILLLVALLQAAPGSVSATQADGSPRRPHWLLVRSVPSGANVLIDGQLEGTTPFGRWILDPTRNYAITVRRAGYEPRERTLSASEWIERGDHRLYVLVKLNPSPDTPDEIQSPGPPPVRPDPPKTAPAPAFVFDPWLRTVCSTLEPDGEQFLPYEWWSPALRRVIHYYRDMAQRLIGETVMFEVIGEADCNFNAAYAPKPYPLMIFNYEAMRVHVEALDKKELNRLLIHELAHHYEPEHLAEGFYQACSRLGAKLVDIALASPELFKL